MPWLHEDSSKNMEGEPFDPVLKPHPSELHAMLFEFTMRGCL